MSVSEKGSVEERTIDRRMGVFSAVMMPLLEIGAVGFVAYVFIYSLCIQYLLAPSADLQSKGISPRRSTAIGLITIFCILLLLLLLTWMRLLQVIWTNPGLTSVGNPNSEKLSTPTKYFDTYSAYISDYEGSPQWCDKCHNWKPDRTHHCRELGRCVRKMDHYCPWAGGIVGETTHKFFLQFLFYGALFTTFSMVPLAVFLAERIQLLRGNKPATWIAALALSAIFCVFAGTMFFMTFWNLTINYTTIETLQRGGVHNITLLATRGHSPRRNSSRSEQRASHREPPNVLREVSREGGREYVVFQTQPFDHPWDLGSAANIRSVMGSHVQDWFIPLKMSPCIPRDNARGEYGWSRQVLDMASDWEAANPGRRLQLLSDTGRRRRSVAS